MLAMTKVADVINSKLLTTLCLLVIAIQNVEPCDRDEFVRHNDTFTMKSSYYPNDYPPNRICTYKYRATSDYKIRIRFTAFQVESANNNGVCAFDYIEIFDGDNENAPLFGKFCGADLPPIIVTSGQDLTVVFVADDTIQEFGFRASVTSVPWYYREPLPTAAPGSCSTILRQTGGAFYSPGYPESYTSGQTCIYIVSLPDDSQHVLLRFTSFDIEPSHECVYDYVEIRDGISSVSPIIGRYCGGRSNKPPRLIESSGPDIHVTFRSDISATFDGFYAEYASSDLGFPDGRTGDVLGEDVGDVEELVAVCDFSRQLQTERGGIVVSHSSYPDGNYGTGLTCSMVFVGSESNEKILLNVIEMDLPGGNSLPCGSDSLTIVDGDLSSLAGGRNELATLCGSITGQYSSSSISGLVLFQTDAARDTGYNGFKLVYSVYYEDPYGCLGDDFHCKNSRCIDKSLKCDGYDHCGDNSDETKGCKGEQERIQWTIALICIGGIVVMVVSASIAFFIVKNVKQPPRRNPQLDTNTLTTISGNDITSSSNGVSRSQGFANHTYEATTTGTINTEIQQQPPSYSQIYNDNNDPAHPPPLAPRDSKLYPKQEYTMFLASGLDTGAPTPASAPTLTPAPSAVEKAPQNGSANNEHTYEPIDANEKPTYNPPDIQITHTPSVRDGQLPPLRGSRNNPLPPGSGLPPIRGTPGARTLNDNP